MTGEADLPEEFGDASSAQRQRAYRWGLSAETLVAWALRLKGYRILARRYRVHRGEIDLIVRRGRVVAFVEVKARRTVTEAVEAVSWRTRRRIEAAAAVWSARHPGYADCDHRFDIVAVVPWRWPSHVADAYRIGE